MNFEKKRQATAWVAGLLTSSCLAFTSAGAAEPPICLGRRATIVGTPGPDRLIGTPARDVIVGRSGDDRILGRAGRDLVCGGPGADTVHGGVGRDNLSGEGGDDTLVGGRSFDGIVGGSGNDAISGGKGTLDVLDGNGGDDLLNGGPGLDLLLYWGAPRGVHVDLASGTSSGWGSDEVSSIEWIEGSEFDDELIGDGRSNIFFGNSGDDRMLGLGGGDPAALSGDFLDGGQGDDDIDGGAGFDRVTFQNACCRITADLSTGTASGQGSDTLDGVEGLFGNGLNDTLIGDGGDNVFWGQRGNDTLDGGGGTDMVSFETFFGSPGPVVADLSTGDATGVGDDSLIGIENLRGTSRADTLIGNDVANVLAGLAGNDSISAAGGDDTLRGGTGNDSLDGGEGTDACLGGETETNCEGSESTSPFGLGSATAPNPGIPARWSPGLRAALLRMFAGGW